MPSLHAVKKDEDRTPRQTEPTQHCPPQILETFGRRTRIRLEGGGEDKQSGHETVRKVKLLETNTLLSYSKLQITLEISLAIKKHDYTQTF